MLMTDQIVYLASSALILLENYTLCFPTLRQTPKNVYIRLGKHYSAIICIFLK